MQILKVRYFVLFLKMRMTIVGDLQLMLKVMLPCNPLGCDIEIGFA